ncbi:uncharacterized protein PHACADRAFT_24172 [Phanerochaete carnosa HHB-10118-sp]|uniref:Uncharacterized protein n=1 Tax=Phanerochaete carnosa (strain HHB-10118-sp) TaxID=650164 RepID=K5WAI6_PHACS|nr:uncharacterized protein PHACADRAFT_24172 [Phanerochaete carnosa HHB-10118-sp]EKM60943.1 hypothetical protein PHACADRAFT_24172 [Phanerochaete carnosa HHB-10118-sp]
MRLDCVLVARPPHKRRRIDSQAGRTDVTAPTSQRPMRPTVSLSSVKKQRASSAGAVTKKTPFQPTGSGKSTVGSTTTAATFGLLTPTSTATAQHTPNDAPSGTEKGHPAIPESDIVYGTNPDSEPLILPTASTRAASQAPASLLAANEPPPDVLLRQSPPHRQDVPGCDGLENADPSLVSFELLDVPDLPSWVSTSVPSLDDTGRLSQQERELYLPSGVSSVLTAMKHSLASERAARLRAETLYELETRLRAAAQRKTEHEALLRARAEREAERQRAENARIQRRHREWISATSASLVDSLTQFSERLLKEAGALSRPLSSTPAPQAAKTSSAGDAAD